MTFEEALAAISSLQTKGWRLGLDRMEEFVRRAGLDGVSGGAPTSPRFVHIAGTNGKGSVTAFCQSLLVSQGWRTGATYSPYVYDVRERIQIDRNLIDPAMFARLTERLWPIAQSMEGTTWEGPTEFEFKTALGFAAWAEAKCDWVALEVGLGGRLDATNIVSPASTAIVSIGLDHVEILGDTLSKIATEKAGIIKTGVPVVVGEMVDETLAAILSIAESKGAPVWLLGREVRYEVEDSGVVVTGPDFAHHGLRPGILGARQPHNLAVAIASLHAAGAIRDRSAVAEGAPLARLPGRMERRAVSGQAYILDGAHNRDAAISVVESLGMEKPAAMIAGMVQGHDAKSFFAPFGAIVDEVHLVPIAFHRTRSPQDLANEIKGLFSKVHVHRSVQEAIAALSDVAGPILVTGSFYLVGEVGKLLEELARNESDDADSLGPGTA